MQVSRVRLCKYVEILLSLMVCNASLVLYLFTCIFLLLLFLNRAVFNKIERLISSIPLATDT
jgi:hypothetical protein